MVNPHGRIRKQRKGKRGAYDRHYRHGGHGKSGEQIDVVSREAAEGWAEEHLDGDRYIAAFGVPDEVPRITVALTPENRKKLEGVRAETGMTFVEIINDAIKKY